MRKIIVIFGLGLMVLACKEEKKKDIEVVVTEVVPESFNEWISLMNVKHWRGYNQESLPGNWKIADGVIECFGEAGDVGGDIISMKQYDNFELSLEWKISEGGNSGVFYHVVEDTIYHSPYQTAPEYQILDDVGFPHPLEDWQKTGANYAMHLANDKKVLKPVGEWNTTKIIFDNGKVEHWLNGEKIVAFDKYTDDWKAKRNSGKWNDYPDYGNTNSGYLALQDHGAGVWFRDVKVRELE
ncbi:MAG: glycosyl hydrolase [Flavobacteriaceae bacterium]|nr:MAG: glycosyl hydrolase [Flavobacteriaceae bacterium]